MGLTSSLITGLSGLAANQGRLDVIGNNIANVNTVGFKSSRLDFKSQFSQTFSYGTQPDSTLGGTNPLQIGLGTTDAAVTRNFNDGSREVTGVDTNLAVQGNGFFIMKGTDTTYTRDGTFKLNSANTLVNGDGKKVQGFGIDSNYNVIPGVLTDLTIPIGSLTIASATTNSQFAGNLASNGTVASTVSNLTMGQPLYLKGAAAIDPTNPPTSATLLTNVTDATNSSYYQVGDIISATGKQGGPSIPSKSMTVTATTTLGDLQSFLQGTLAINTTPGINGAAAAPGVTVPATLNAATLTVSGNLGTANDLTLDSSSITISRAGVTTAPFTFVKNASANGESISTSFTAYDSLGAPVNTKITATLTQASSSGTIWTFTAQSPDGTASGPATNEVVGQGTLTFDNSGKLLSTTGTTLAIDRAGTGATPTLNFSLNFSKLTSLSGASSTLAQTLGDGTAKGTLTSFSIGQDGTITGQFSNGLNRPLGQVALATFANNLGLVDNGGNQFIPGPNSGTPVISAPNQFSAGSIISGALELSNVDLSAEFVSLISASTGFSASSRVITTSNTLMQELLQTAR